jgi:hypothetical protein
MFHVNSVHHRLRFGSAAVSTPGLVIAQSAAVSKRKMETVSLAHDMSA